MSPSPESTDSLPAAGPLPCARGPFMHAQEGARTIFLVTMVAACGPLLAGLLLFGFRAAIVSALAIGSCVLIERLYYRVTKLPSLLGRSHAFLTGVLLALTLPPFVAWYVPVTAAAVAIIVGKAVFGGVGHFLWQPALVGRLAVAAIFANPAIGANLNPDSWPILAQNRLLVGDVRNAKPVENPHQWQWRGTPAPAGKDGFLMPTPRQMLAGITDSREPAYSSIAGLVGGSGPDPYDRFANGSLADNDATTAPDAAPGARLQTLPTPPAAPPDAAGPPKPVLILSLPPINDLIYGAYPGGIGETCAAVIVMAGLYLIYRNYVRWQVPVFFVLSAAVTAAVCPIYLAGPNDTVTTCWLPVLAEGTDVGAVYVSYQLLGGEMLLAAFFFATEMTSRPVTRGGATIFAIGCGVTAMLLRMYTTLPIPAFLAVLVMNTLTPWIDAFWRPRVLGTKRWGKR